VEWDLHVFFYYMNLKGGRGSVFFVKGVEVDYQVIKNQAM